MVGQCGSRTFNQEIQELFLADDNWEEKGTCPLSHYDGDYFTYCAVKGKLYKTNPTLKSDPAYANCNGNISECPYEKPEIQSLLTRKVLILDKTFKTKLEGLIKTRDSIREEQILSASR